MRRYKIGEMSRLLGIPAVTIRFLEDKGLLTPKRDADSGYRTYDIWDVNLLLEYQKYRQMGFDSAQTVALVKSGDMDLLAEQLESKRQEALQQAQYYQAKAIKYQNFQTVLRHARQMLGRYLILNRPDNYSVFNRFLEPDGLRTVEYTDAGNPAERLRAHAPFVENVYCIRQNWFRDPRRPYETQCGFTMKRQWCDTLGITDTDKMEYFPAAPAVFTVVRLGERDFFTPALLEGTFRFLRENGYTLNGDVLGIYLCTVTEDGRNVRYFELWTPIRSQEAARAPAVMQDDFPALHQIFS